MSDSREITTEVSGFYPLFETLLEKYKDLITPAVFGVAWRYCQMRDGVCKASLRKIALILNVSEATIMRRLETLCEDGYLIDTTPDARNVPHVYVDAGLVTMKSTLGVVETVSHRNSTESASRRNKSVSQGNETVSESQLIKESIKDSNRELKDPLSSSLINERDEIFSIYEQEIGPLTPHLADELQEAEQVHGAQWVSEALRIASANGKRNWAYVKGILNRWKADGYGVENKKNLLPSAPAINERAIQETIKQATEKWNHKFAPPPANRPRIGQGKTS